MTTLSQKYTIFLIWISVRILELSRQIQSSFMDAWSKASSPLRSPVNDCTSYVSSIGSCWMNDSEGLWEDMSKYHVRFSGKIAIKTSYWSTAQNKQNPCRKTKFWIRSLSLCAGFKPRLWWTPCPYGLHQDWKSNWIQWSNDRRHSRKTRRFPWL